MGGYGSELHIAFEMPKIGSKDEFPKWVSLETKIQNHFMVYLSLAASTDPFSIFKLVGGFKHFLCSLIYGIILPIDIFFRGVGIPPTSQALSGHQS
jgi:hypothetical protein